jgi:type I restriction enzyme M protein
MAKQNNHSTANLGFEDRLWAAADKLRGNMDAAEYKHVVLGLIFLKYISDAFMEKFNALQADDLADPEDKDEYLADNIFWVPTEARWSYLQKNAKRPEIGTLVDDAMAAIERDNKVLKGVLPKDYARPALDKARLGEIIDLIATIGLGDEKSRQQDILGRVYEYFLAKFAAAEGKLGGQFYTAQCVVRLLVEMLEPYKGRVFDPCCGSGGMFVQAAKFVQAHASSNGNGKNANYAWILHFLHHLAPQGTAGFVLANGSLTSNTSGEGAIRRAIIEHDLVDCIIALPGQLFYTTPIPVCLWFLTRNKGADKVRGFRARHGETLFIDARKLGELTDRVHRELTDDEVAEIARTYHAWRGEQNAGKYEDKPGFCKSATLKEIEAHGHVLTPGRYVGAEEIEDDGIPFEEKMAELSAELYEQMGEAQELDATIRRNLEVLGYGE